jgi:hypothetical protein
VTVVGCGGDDGASSTTAATSSPVTEAQEPWDLLYISDSTGWKAAEAYARLAEEQLCVPVQIIDWRIPRLSMVAALKKIQESDVVAEAEIIVLWANPEGSGVKDDYVACQTLSGAHPGVYTVEDWAPFADLFGEALDAIWAARGDQPTVLRATDMYVPILEQWRQAGIDDDCEHGMEAMSEALGAAAEAHGATMVSAYDVYNGPNHDEDAVAKGYIDADGIHPSEAGGQAMAEAFAATGFEPTPAP